MKEQVTGVDKEQEAQEEIIRRRSAKITKEQRDEIAMKQRDNPGMRQKNLATCANKKFSVELSQPAIFAILLSCASGYSGTLTVLVKQRICVVKTRNPHMTQKQLAEWAKLHLNLTKAPTQPTKGTHGNKHLERNLYEATHAATLFRGRDRVSQLETTMPGTKRHVDRHFDTI